MGRLGSLVKDTAVYGISSILGRMLNWLLVPLYTQYLLPEKYGIVTELYAYVAFLVIVYTYGMETSFFRFTTKTDSDRSKVYSLSETSLVISSILFSGLIIIFASPITDYLGYPNKEKYIVWFAIILGIDALVAIPFAKLRLENRSKRFALLKLLNIGLNVGFNLFFIVFCHYVVNNIKSGFLFNTVSAFYAGEDMVDYIFISNLLANIALLLIFLPEIIRMRFHIDLKILRKMYVYGFPIMIMSLAGVTNEMLSRVVLKRWLPEDFYPNISNQAALGIFGAAYKLSIFMTMAIQAFRYAAEPFFFARAKDIDSKELFARIMYGYVLFAIFILIIISLNLDIIGSLFLRSEAYREGLLVVPVLLLANLFLGVYYNLSVWFKLTDKTYYGTLISTSGALITIVANYILIPLIGYLGSAVSALICYFTMAVVSFIMGQNFYPIPYRISKLLMIIGLGGLITFVGYYILPTQTEFYKLFQLFLFFLFVGIMALIERKRISNITQTLRNK
jgi:O-antigen/teichoic acid export membrane protein